LLGDTDTSSDGSFALADRKFEINRGEQKFAKDSKSYLGLATGTVASQAIAVPSGFLGVHQLIVNNINLTGKFEMNLADYEHFINGGDDQYFMWVTAAGTRQFNFIDSNTDGEAYRLYYFKKPATDLSDNSDESPFQDEYREASVYYAASRLLPQLGKIQLAEYYKGEYLSLASQAREETEGLIMSQVRALPNVGEQYQFDKDIQGIGTIDA